MKKRQYRQTNMRNFSNTPAYNPYQSIGNIPEQVTYHYLQKASAYAIIATIVILMALILVS